MVMPMPTSKDRKIYNTVNSPYAYSISGDCKDPESAWKLISFLNRSDNNIEYCKMGGLIPIKKMFPVMLPMEKTGRTVLL